MFYDVDHRVAAYLTAMERDALEPPMAMDAMQIRPDRSWRIYQIVNLYN
jgi:hypothetical protein